MNIPTGTGNSSTTILTSTSTSIKAITGTIRQFIDPAKLLISVDNFGNMNVPDMINGEDFLITLSVPYKNDIQTDKQKYWICRSYVLEEC